MLDMEVLRKKIIDFHINHPTESFGCRCSECGRDPYGLVERGDVIPLIYIFVYAAPPNKLFCFRCLEGQ